MLRVVEIRNSSPPLSKPHPPQNSGPFLPIASPTTSRHFSGRNVGPFCGTKGRIDRQQMDPLYRSKLVQDPIQVSSSSVDFSEKSDSISFPPPRPPPPPLGARSLNFSRNGQWKGSESRNSRFLLLDVTSTGFY